MSALTSLWKARVPVFLAVAVVLLVIATLRANDQRECRQVCVKHRFADGVYARERPRSRAAVSASPRTDKLVPAPQPERR